MSAEWNSTRAASCSSLECRSKRARISSPLISHFIIHKEWELAEKKHTHFTRKIHVERVQTTSKKWRWVLNILENPQVAWDVLYTFNELFDYDRMFRKSIKLNFKFVRRFTKISERKNLFKLSGRLIGLWPSEFSINSPSFTSYRLSLVADLTNN